MILDKLKDKVGEISSEIKKHFHPCDICGTSITLDIDRCPSCEQAYIELTEPDKAPQNQEQLNALINRFVRILPKMQEGGLKNTIISHLDRLREKSSEIGKAEQAIAAASTASKKLSQPILQSNTENIAGYTTVSQHGLVSASKTITLTSNDGQRETDEAVEATLHALLLKADKLAANAVVNIRIGYTGIESMTLAPRVLLTITGTAVTVIPAIANTAETSPHGTAAPVAGMTSGQ
ncbi:MAG: heavy metal-binding domain-containing protein [Oxalobacter sp.]|nr:heavy metal-binding domain-containing protein [Oxalobacter sp.]